MYIYTFEITKLHLKHNEFQSQKRWEPLTGRRTLCVQSFSFVMVQVSFHTPSYKSDLWPFWERDSRLTHGLKASVKHRANTSTSIYGPKSGDFSLYGLCEEAFFNNAMWGSLSQGPFLEYLTLSSCTRKPRPNYADAGTETICGASPGSRIPPDGNTWIHLRAASAALFT